MKELDGGDARGLQDPFPTGKLPDNAPKLMAALKAASYEATL